MIYIYIYQGNTVVILQFEIRLTKTTVEKFYINFFKL